MLSETIPNSSPSVLVDVSKMQAISVSKFGWYNILADKAVTHDVKTRAEA
jgi:hypothetical protein